MKRAFEVKLKAFFIILKGLSDAQSCLRPYSAPLRIKKSQIREINKKFKLKNPLVLVVKKLMQYLGISKATRREQILVKFWKDTKF